jgi:hypothetical protein
MVGEWGDGDGWEGCSGMVGKWDSGRVGEWSNGDGWGVGSVDG